MNDRAVDLMQQKADAHNVEHIALDHARAFASSFAIAFDLSALKHIAMHEGENVCNPLR